MLNCVGVCVCKGVGAILLLDLVIILHVLLLQVAETEINIEAVMLLKTLRSGNQDALLGILQLLRVLFDNNMKSAFVKLTFAVDSYIISRDFIRALYSQLLTLCVKVRNLRKLKLNCFNRNKLRHTHNFHLYLNVTQKSVNIIYTFLSSPFSPLNNDCDETISESDSIKVRFY